MAITPLPAQGSASWYAWASDIDTAARAAGGAVPDASTTAKGIVELATTAETQAGTDTVRAITPAAAAATFVTQANAVSLAATEDAVAGMFTGGTNSGITFSYNSSTKLVNTTVTPGAVADATTTSKGAVQLAGDLAGTAAAPTVPGKAPLLTPTATKTTAYTAVVGDLAMMNVAGGGTTLTLPAAPANKAQVGYRAIGATTGTPLTVNRGGTDTIGTAGATSASVIFADETVVLQYDAPNTRWLGITSARSQASLDARYDLAGAASTAQAFAIQRANHTGTQAASTITGLATVATSGAYTDLSAKPTIPTVGAAGAGAAIALSSTDASVTNSRTPTAHASTHASGGSDPVTPAAIGAAPATVTQTTQTGTTYTFVIGDANTLVESNNAAAVTFTVPPNSSVAFPVGTSISLRQYGAGQVTVAAGAGVTVQSRGAALKLAGQYAEATVTKRATDEWILTGDVTP